ncbi:aminotransferase class V-fold PLP-dependent enzyme [Benzoatithermus flavus]|uniref:Cysteine desulfurase n=1 Tax=Benzoatithermus flavus TaxID=3108223 RepID=A0ABU8XNX3_9PROT
MSTAGLRAQFPIFAAQQGTPFHYLDNAATGQICRAAAEALWHFETRARANVKRGVYRLADEATTAFQKARQEVAAYIGASDPDEVIFTSGCTLAINTAAHALALRLRPGDEILISELEHHSNIVPWQMAAARTGARVRAIPVTPEGRLACDRLDDLVTGRTRIIAVTHASNVTGAVTDVGALRDAADAVGALLLLDGAQRAAHGPLDVQTLGCDLYAFSAHKMFGPTGAGALWVRKDLLLDLPPFLGGGEMIRRVEIERSTYAPPPHRFEAGTPPIGPVIGMGAAAAWLATLDWAALGRQEIELTARTLEGLQSLDGVRIVGPVGTQARIGVVSFAVEGIHPHDVCQMLDEFGLALRGGHHCAQPLMDAFDLPATVRASLAPYNDAADVDALIEGLDTVIRRLR